MSGISDKAIKTNYAENKYRFGGKELQHQEFSDGSGLEEYDFSARFMDPQLGVWHNIDSHADQYQISSPYDYVFDMPTIATDPTGMDTYLEGEAAQEFAAQLKQKKDADINQADDLAQSIEDAHGGETDQNHTIRYNVRKDGSVMFDRQKDAFNFMYDKSIANNNKEEFGVIMKNGVLVLPDSKNKQDENIPESYGYTWANGKLYDPIGKANLSILGTIHTHLDKNSGDPSPSSEDVGYFARRAPYKPILTMGYDHQVHGVYSYYTPGSSVPSYSVIDSFLKPGGLTLEDLLGGYDLSGVLSRLILK
jgi:RHS repeat-associated protein